MSDQGLDGQVLTEEPSSAAYASLSETSMHSINISKAIINNGSGVVLSEVLISTEQTNARIVGNISETVLLDERSLLACIACTISAGGRIPINSTVCL